MSSDSAIASEPNSPRAAGAEPSSPELRFRGKGADGVPIRRRSSLLSLSPLPPLEAPNEQDFEKFDSDHRHFSLIRNLHMADFITLLNGCSGFLSVISCVKYKEHGDVSYITRAMWYTLLGLFFDFLDGRVARLRKKASLMGQELDSLADLISFGVAPATIAYSIGYNSTIDQIVLAVFVLCGLTRLARFNVTVSKIPKDKGGKSKYFEGTPIPTTLILVAVMYFIVVTGRIGQSEAMFGGIVNTLAEKGFIVHPFVLLFGLSGSAMISKSLKIPKP